MNNKKNLFLVVLIAIFLTACGAFKPKYTDSRKVPIKGAEKARKNIEEGRGISLGSLGKNRSTNFEFSSSNPLWRASLEFFEAPEGWPVVLLCPMMELWFVSCILAAMSPETCSR